MAVEISGYPAFSTFPTTGPLTGPPRPIDPTSRQVRVTLTGTTFSVRAQISNAQTGTVAPHLFIPPEASWETFATLTEPSIPLTIPGPMRWVRLVLDSGTVTGGNVEQTSADERGDGVTEERVLEIIGSNLVSMGTDSVTIAGMTLTGSTITVAGGIVGGTDSVTIGGDTITGSVIGL